jgi:putative zinc finger protein
MPSEPRIPAEPTLEELSAYLDHELDASTQARIADHVAGCADCTRRLDGLRETVHAVRALPMETPTRKFTIPAQRRQSFRWAPVGWLGAGAAAMLVVVIGVSQLHFQGPASTASTNTASGGLAYGPATRNPKGAVAPLAAPVPSTQQFDAQSSAAAANGAIVSDPTNSARRLVLDTDRSSYATNGRMRVTVQLIGSPSTSLNSGDQGLTLTLVRNGQGVALNPVGVESFNGTPIFGGWYDLASFPLSAPRAGDYRLEATWLIPDGSGRVLQASIPVRIAG